MLGTVRSQVQQLDPRLPISDIWTLSDVVYRSLWAPRMAAWLLTLTLTGVAIGLTTALAASRLVAGLLYGSATDPVTFVAIPAMLAAATLVASYVPARRATRIEPIVALRTEA